VAELTLEMLRAELAPVNKRLDTLGGEIAAMRADVAALRPNIDGIPLLQRAINTIHQEQLMMKAAINEIARTQFTSGEVQALHDDVNSVQATHLQLETRILTLEREVKEAKEALEALKQR
jgi:predicted  nucleic acid-binding Zn-ribbon protein